MDKGATVISLEQSGESEFADVKPGIERQLGIFSELYDEIRKIVKIEKEEQMKFSGSPLLNVNVARANKLIGRLNGNTIFCSFSTHLHDTIGLPLYSLSLNFYLAVPNILGDFDDWSWVKSNSLEHLRITGVYYSKSAIQDLRGMRSYDPEIDVCFQPLLSSIVYRIFNLYKQKMGDLL